MNNNKVLKEINRDSLDEFEKIKGKRWDSFDENEAFEFLLKQGVENKKKSEVLKSENDTCYGMSWGEYKELLKKNGFIEGHSERYEYEAWGDISIEEVILYYQPELNLIVWSQSYSGMTTINSGSLYGYLKKKSYLDSHPFSYINCSNRYDEDADLYHFDIDVRQGLFTQLKELSKRGSFESGDFSSRFLWFLKLGEDSENYKELTREKINKSTNECKRVFEIK